MEEDHNAARVLLNNIPILINEEDNTKLITPFSKEEITSIIFMMGKYKSPSHDGFPARFFKQFWNIVGDDVINAVQEFQNHNNLLKYWNITFLILITKVQDANNLKNIIPIGLCNIIYKMIKKLMANKMVEFIPKIISLKQDGFVRHK